jgi:uncharacterized membrane protein YccC
MGFEVTSAAAFIIGVMIGAPMGFLLVSLFQVTRVDEDQSLYEAGGKA